LSFEGVDVIIAKETMWHNDIGCQGKGEIIMKKVWLTALLVSMVMVCVGCGAKDETDEKDEVNVTVEETQDGGSIDGDSMDEEALQEMVAQPEGEAEEIIETESASGEASLAESTEFTFADLSKYQFEFCSGAGGWSEEFTIEKDGYFTGKYHDSDMGSTGEGYDNGTFYCCTYSGHFTDLVKIDDYTYEMKLADIVYDDEVGTEEIIDGVLYVYTGSYCLGSSDTFIVYLPGKPMEEISEDVKSWIYSSNDGEDELIFVAIADIDNGYGIYSYDRWEPLEDAQMTYNAYKESFDYYTELVVNAETTPEMVEYTGRMYEVADDCLNYIWNLVRYNVDEDEYATILEEQRTWIAEKEAKAKEASDEFEGGTFAPVAYNDVLATLTMERCEALIEYLR